MPHIQLAEGFRLYYQEHNPTRKRVIVLLHGLGATSASWDLQIPALTQSGWRVIAPDFRGFGWSDYPGNFDIRSVAGDIHDLIRYMNVKKAVIAGISLGGTIALQYAIDHPAPTRALVLINTFARLRPSDPKVWLYFLTRILLVHTLGLATQAKAVAQRIFPHPDQEDLRKILREQIQQANPRAYRAAMRALSRFDLRRQAAGIIAPTLIVTGGADTTVPATNQKQLAQFIPDARQVIIPGAGHAVTAECPGEFNQVLLGFLKQIP